MKLVALLLLALLAVPALAPVASARPCQDAPYLPGALSGYYDMWNNIYRHYVCEVVLRGINGGGAGYAEVALP